MARKRTTPAKSPYQILQFSLLGEEVSVAVDKNQLRYTIEREGKRYGNAVDVKSRKAIDITAAAFLLACNAVDTIKSFANENENK